MHVRVISAKIENQFVNIIPIPGQGFFESGLDQVLVSIHHYGSHCSGGKVILDQDKFSSMIPNWGLAR